MSKLSSERGEVSALLLSVVILATLFVGAAGFGVWAFMERQDYKDNSDAKVASAVAANTTKVQAADAKKYTEEAKKPTKTFSGPDAYGSVKVTYPKTWSAYAEESTTSDPMDVYFHNDYVPSTDSKQTYQLRVQITSRSYDKELAAYTTLISKGSVNASAYSLPKVSEVVGTRLTGAIVPTSKDIQGTMVMLPLRDKTLKIWAESNDYLNDLNTYVLPTTTFLP